MTDVDTTGGGLAVGEEDEARRYIGLRLAVIARLLRNNFDRRVAGLHVTRSQWAMIAVAARHPGATQRMMAESLEISEASAGRLIDRLCVDGLLERRDRADDRRARAVYVTDAARPLLQQLAVIAEEGEERLLRGFSPQDIATLESLLDRLYANASRG